MGVGGFCRFMESPHDNGNMHWNHEPRRDELRESHFSLKSGTRVTRPFEEGRFMENPHDNGIMHGEHEPHNLPMSSSHTLSYEMVRH